MGHPSARRQWCADGGIRMDEARSAGRYARRAAVAQTINCASYRLGGLANPRPRLRRDHERFAGTGAVRVVGRDAADHARRGPGARRFAPHRALGPLDLCSLADRGTYGPAGRLLADAGDGGPGRLRAETGRYLHALRHLVRPRRPWRCQQRLIAVQRARPGPDLAWRIHLRLERLSLATRLDRG